MKPYIIAGIVVGIIALVFAGCAVAETIMYPDDDGVENVTVDLNNASDHANSTTVLVKKDPKGILHNLFKQKEKVNKYGIMEYNGGLWIKNPNGVWVQIARINNQGIVIEIYTFNHNIIHSISHDYTITNNTNIFPHNLNNITGEGNIDSNVTTNNTTATTNNITDATIDAIIANTTAEELGVNASDVVLDDNMTDNMTENDTNITDDMDMDSGDEFYYDDSGYDDYYYDDEYYYDDYY